MDRAYCYNLLTTRSFPTFLSRCGIIIESRLTEGRRRPSFVLRLLQDGVFNVYRNFSKRCTTVESLRRKNEEERNEGKETVVGRPTVSYWLCRVCLN